MSSTSHSLALPCAGGISKEWASGWERCMLPVWWHSLWCRHMAHSTSLRKASSKSFVTSLARCSPPPHLPFGPFNFLTTSALSTIATLDSYESIYLSHYCTEFCEIMFLHALAITDRCVTACMMHAAPALSSIALSNFADDKSKHRTCTGRLLRGTLSTSWVLLTLLPLVRPRYRAAEDLFLQKASSWMAGGMDRKTALLKSGVLLQACYLQL